MTREEAIKILKEIEYPVNGDNKEYRDMAFDMAVKALEQKPKTGHWIKYGMPRCGEQHYQCTACKYYVNFGQWGELYTKEFKYCPNCGVKMEER